MPFPGPRRVPCLMLDPLAALNVAMIGTAAVVGGVVGSWRAIRSIRKAEAAPAAETGEVALGMAAQRERIDALIAKNQELVLKVAALEREVAALREELDIEKRITRRLAVYEEMGDE